MVQTLAETIQLLGCDSWSEIKLAFMKANNICFMENEEVAHFNFKNISTEYPSYTNLIGLTVRTLSGTKEAYVKTLSFGKKGKRSCLVINDTWSVFPATILAECKCIDCNSCVTVSCNPAKWFRYYHGPLCRSCKKKAVTKTDTYWETYKTSMVSKYGAEFPLQNKKIHKKFNNTMQERYGVNYSGESAELGLKSWHNTVWKHKTSKQEMDLANCLLIKFPEIKCVYSAQRHSIRIDNKVFYPDISLGKKLVEYFGDFWHCNPSLYDKDFIMPNKKKASEIWEQDRKRFSTLISSGYSVLVIWEQDMKNDKENTLQIIENFLNGT
jgi:G:T-mismatch repair DNA endonuclease (very short patch repair protein)